MTKQEIIDQCEASGIGYKLNNGKLAVFDTTQLPGAIRSQFDVNGRLIEAAAAKPLPIDAKTVEPVEAVRQVKPTKKGSSK